MGNTAYILSSNDSVESALSRASFSLYDRMWAMAYKYKGTENSPDTDNVSEQIKKFFEQLTNRRIQAGERTLAITHLYRILIIAKLNALIEEMGSGDEDLGQWGD